MNTVVEKLRHHVVNGVFPSNALHNGEVVTALGGRTLHISINSSKNNTYHIIEVSVNKNGNRYQVVVLA
jgi:uncharacterized surface protein with fasciclin (FAS1) repeats